MTKLDTDYGPFVELISVGRVFNVPRYQRPYSWTTKKEIPELWGDIVRVYRGRMDPARTEVEMHFIGPVVIGETTPKALGPVEAPIIDGQQRLITLSLLVAAIRDEVVEADDDKLELTGQYLAHLKGADVSSLRVRPGRTDLQTYEEIIRERPVSTTRNKIYRAYEYFRQSLRNAPPHLEIDDEEDLAESPEGMDRGSGSSESSDDGSDNDEESEMAEEPEPGASWDWQELLEVVGSQLALVQIDGVPAENAYQIFATLNHKGLPLKQVDLIRNSVFMLLPTRSESVYEDMWVPLEESMGQDLLESFLHAWVVHQGRNVPRKDTYRSFLREISGPGVSEQEVVEVLAAVKSAAWSYLLIVDPLGPSREPFGDRKVPREVVTALMRLRDWGSAPLEPTLLELVERWKTGGLTAKKLVGLLLKLESFVVRRFLVQVPPNDLRSTFGRMTQQLVGSDDNGLTATLTSALQEPARRWPSDADVRDAFVTKPLYRNPGRRQSFFVLKRLAESLDGKEVDKIVLGTSATSYSMEHILPQGDLPDWWQADLENWGDPDPYETWATRVHTAGNLTLTAYNSELNNRSFEEKKVWIADQLKLQMSKAILDEDRWTRSEIEARSSELSQVAMLIWPRG